MVHYVIKLKKRGVFSFNDYDIVVFKSTAAPNQSPIAKIGKYKAVLGASYEGLSLDFDVLFYWLSKGARLHSNVRKLLLLK